MKILIIGSSGFIGSHLVQYFAKKGLAVLGCDIKPSLTDNKTTVLLPADIHDYTGLFKNKNFDYCINASGSASVPFSIVNPAEDFHLNVANVNLILHAIRNENPACGFINFSSAAVYGNPASLPVKEEAKLAPVSPYGFHKMISEQICAEFWKLYKIRTCSLRVFSAYGPGLRKQIFWDLYQKTNSSSTIELFGTGEESRDFIYIEDLCNAVNCIILNAPMNGESINVASGAEITIHSAVESFMKGYHPLTKFIFNGQEKPGDPLNWQADVSRLRSYGFIPTYSLQQGIENYCTWLNSIKTH